MSWKGKSCSGAIQGRTTAIQTVQESAEPKSQQKEEAEKSRKKQKIIFAMAHSSKLLPPYK